MSRAMEKPQAQTVRHLLQSTNCYLVVRKEQFGAMGIHIPQKKWGATRSYCDRLRGNLFQQFGSVSLARSNEM